MLLCSRSALGALGPLVRELRRVRTLPFGTELVLVTDAAQHTLAACPRSGRARSAMRTCAETFRAVVKILKFQSRRSLRSLL